jgi:hypothetical protein
MEWILTRLAEPSTWRGVILLATSFGITVSPDMINAIVAIGLALVGLINVIRKEKPRPLPWADDHPLPPQPKE